MDKLEIELAEVREGYVMSLSRAHKDTVASTARCVSFSFHDAMRCAAVSLLPYPFPTGRYADLKENSYTTDNPPYVPSR